jgi:threonyl-tRNA synthetase
MQHGSKVYDILNASDFFVDLLETDGLTLPKMIKQAQLAQYNYILVIGDREEENGTVNVRTRDGEILGEMSVDSGNDELLNFLNEKRSY